MSGLLGFINGLGQGMSSFGKAWEKLALDQAAEQRQINRLNLQHQWQLDAEKRKRDYLTEDRRYNETFAEQQRKQRNEDARQQAIFNQDLRLKGDKEILQNKYELSKRMMQEELADQIAAINASNYSPEEKAKMVQDVKLRAGGVPVEPSMSNKERMNFNLTIDNETGSAVASYMDANKDYFENLRKINPALYSQAVHDLTKGYKEYRINAAKGDLNAVNPLLYPPPEKPSLWDKLWRTPQPVNQPTGLLPRATQRRGDRSY